MVMKIHRIYVTELFGIFNHDILMKDNITIIHGLNGFGKTALLTLIDALFNTKYNNLLRFPFTEFCIEFDDKSSLSITKTKVKNKKRKTMKIFSEDVKVRYEKPGKKTQNFDFNSVLKTNLLQRSTHIDHYSLKKEIDIFKSLSPFELEYLKKRRIHGLFDETTEPKWFKQLMESIDVRFIETQRLLILNSNKDRK